MNDQLDVIADIHRRRILVDLLDRDLRTDGGLVVDAIEPGDGSASVSDAVSLYHHHLPRLDEEGYVAWNRYTNEVERGPKYDEIRPLLELLDDNADELPGEWV